MFYSLTGIVVPIGNLYNGEMVIGDREATQVEIAAYTEKQQVQQEIARAKQYLFETDFKMLPDYTPAEGSESLNSIKVKRATAREFIRANE